MSKLKVVWTSQFKKDYNAAMKSHLDMDLLDDVIRSLANQEELDPQIQGPSLIRKLEIVHGMPHQARLASHLQNRERQAYPDIG